MTQEGMEASTNASGETGSTGETGGEVTPDYAGFNTPEELATAHQGLLEEKATLETRINDLVSNQGKSGTEIGNLRTALANLQGQIKAYQETAPKTDTGPSLDDIARQVENGDISEAEGIKLAAQTASKATETKLGKQFKDMMQSEIGNLKAEAEREKYVSKFLGNNPGYKEAYESGSLNKWIQQGATGEQAWTSYQLEATQAELEQLKGQAEKEKAEAEKTGIEKGVKIEQGKTPAGKVLSGKTTAFSQKGDNVDLTNPNQRRQAGVGLLKQMRTPGG